MITQNGLGEDTRSQDLSPSADAVQEPPSVLHPADIARAVVLFEGLMACVADACRVHDGPLHSDGYVWRHKADGTVEEASLFDYMTLANCLVRTAHLWRGDDPQGRLGWMADRIAEMEARLLPQWQPMATAPEDEPIIAIGRYETAMAGFPRMVSWFDGAWRDIGRERGEALVCWGWMPRPQSWPNEHADAGSQDGPKGAPSAQTSGQANDTNQTKAESPDV